MALALDGRRLIVLTDPEEIALVQAAREPGLRIATRPAIGIDAISRDFLRMRDFNGQSLLELGPGHYEFCEYVRARGARATVVEVDGAIAELGRRRGHAVLTHDLRELPALSTSARFDGLFGRGSTNPFWFHGDTAALERYTESLVQLTAPGGWIWIVSCPFALTDIGTTDFAAWLSVERRIYREFGFNEWEVGWTALGAVYGISVPCDGLRVYTRNLPPHRWSPQSLARAAVLTARRPVGRALRRLTGRGEPD